MMVRFLRGRGGGGTNDIPKVPYKGVGMPSMKERLIAPAFPHAVT